MYNDATPRHNRRASAVYERARACDTPPPKESAVLAMLSCAKCNAGNPPDAVVCRVCAGPLHEDVSPLEAINRNAGDPEVIPAAVRTEHTLGSPVRAWWKLWWLTLREPDAKRKKLRNAALAERRLWVHTGLSAPGMHTVNGIGTTTYGHYQDRGGTYIGTIWFVVVFVPIFPISSWLMSSAGDNRYYFLGKVPHPPPAFITFGVVWGLAAAGVLATMAQGIRDSAYGDVLVYNGFSVPVEVEVGGQARSVGLRETALFADLALGNVYGVARREARTVDTQEIAVSSDTTVWNVAGRGALATMDVVYGPGVGADPRLEPSAVFRTSADFRFTEPPASISSSTSTTHRSYLDNLIDESEVGLEDAAAWLGVQSAAVAERVLRAELTVNPGNVGVLTSLVSLGVVESEEQATMWEQAIAAAPDDVDVHRAYQDTRPHDEALVSTYRERVARAPAAANLYLLARVIDDDAESRVLCGRAVINDPEAPWCYRALAWLDTKAGLFAAAEANLKRFATLRPDDADEVVEDRLRLARLLGRPVEDTIAALDLDEDWADRLRAEADPSTIDAVSVRLGAATAGSPSPADAYRSFAVNLAGGRIDAARAALRATALDASATAATRLTLESSDGGSREELATVLAEELWRLEPPRQVLAVAIRRALRLPAAEHPVVDTLAVADGPSSAKVLALPPRDDAALDALVETLSPAERPWALRASAWLAEADGDLDRATARKTAAKPYLLPGRDPWVR